MIFQPSPVSKHAQLQAAYMLVYRNFAVGRSDVAAALGVSNAVASGLLNTLRDHRLVEATDVNDEAQGHNRRGAYQEVVWQCWQTYDSVGEDEALAIFLAAFPSPKGRSEDASSGASADRPQKAADDTRARRHEMSSTATETSAPANSTVEKPDAAAAMNVLYDSILTDVREIEGAVLTEKSAYMRVSVHGKTVVYVDHPSKKSVRVSFPRKGGGYELVKVTTAKEAEKALARIVKAAAAVTKAEATPPAPAAETAPETALASSPQVEPHPKPESTPRRSRSRRQPAAV